MTTGKRPSKPTTVAEAAPPLLNAEEATAVLQFLDRVQLTGHQERHAMNTVVNKIATLIPTQGTGDAATGD